MIELVPPIQSVERAMQTTETMALLPQAGLFLGKLNEGLQQSSELLHQVAAGQPVATHELMLSYELAKQQLQLAVEVRNKVTEAYQELMRMQL